METLKRICSLASLTVKLTREALATMWQQVGHTLSSRQSRQSRARMTHPTWPSHTGKPSADPGTTGHAMDDGERIPLGVCDRHPSANAGALWVHYGIMLPLTFCGHCDRAHMTALADQGWERSRFNLPAYREGVSA